MKLLVIDDSTEQLENIQDIFEKEGYQVYISSNAFQALQFLSSNKINCVILDLKMPLLEGDHLLTVLHEKYPHIPVIILSAYINDNVEKDLIQKGAYAVIKKSNDIYYLIQSVENAIHEFSRSITFVFNNSNLKKIKNTIISRLVSLALKKSNGNQIKASGILGISRQSLIRYMKKYKISSISFPKKMFK